MIGLKSDKEIKKLIYSGHLLATILQRVGREVKPGVKTIELDRLAEELIRKAGGTPSFKNYRGGPSDPPFPTALCTSVNDAVVHAPASGRVLREGDIIGIDIGMEYDGMFTDMAETFAVGKISAGAKKLLKVTKRCLELGIKQVRPGNHVHDISRAVQDHAEKNGFSVVKDLVGHGVGHAVHEDPMVPNFISDNQPSVELVPGLVIAIEPMVNVGTDKIRVLDDDWTIVTADGKLSAHFEHTVAVTEKGHIIITK